MNILFRAEINIYIYILEWNTRFTDVYLLILYTGTVDLKNIRFDISGVIYKKKERSNEQIIKNIDSNIMRNQYVKACSFKNLNVTFRNVVD